LLTIFTNIFAASLNHDIIVLENWCQATVIRDDWRNGVMEEWNDKKKRAKLSRTED